MKYSCYILYINKVVSWDLFTQFTCCHLSFIHFPSYVMGSVLVRRVIDSWFDNRSNKDNTIESCWVSLSIHHKWVRTQTAQDFFSSLTSTWQSTDQSDTLKHPGTITIIIVKTSMYIHCYCTHKWINWLIVQFANFLTYFCIMNLI